MLDLKTLKIPRGTTPPCGFESCRPHQFIKAHYRQIKSCRSFDHRVGVGEQRGGY